jgi:hypothetical protein
MLKEGFASASHWPPIDALVRASTSSTATTASHRCPVMSVSTQRRQLATRVQSEMPATKGREVSVVWLLLPSSELRLGAVSFAIASVSFALAAVSLTTHGVSHNIAVMSCMITIVSLLTAIMRLYDPNHELHARK